MISDAIKLVRAELEPLPKNTWFEGAQHLKDNATPPRIVWVRKGGGLEPKIDKVGSKPGAPRYLMTRAPMLECHIWGRGDDEAEAMLHNVIRACFNVGQGNMTLGGEEWVPGSHLSLGSVVVLHIGFKIPVTDELLRTARATSAEADASGAMSGDNWLELGD